MQLSLCEPSTHNFSKILVLQKISTLSLKFDSVRPPILMRLASAVVNQQAWLWDSFHYVQP